VGHRAGLDAVVKRKIPGPCSCQKSNISVYKTGTLPVILNGRKMWRVPLREELKLQMSESKVLRKIFEPKTNGVVELLEYDITWNFVMYTYCLDSGSNEA